MLFEKKTDFLFPKEANSFAVGTSASFEIPRELPVDGAELRATTTVSNAIAAQTDFAADGILNVVRKIQVNGPDGARNRNVIDASGPGLIELSKHWTGFLDARTGALINSNRTTGVYSPVAGSTSGGIGSDGKYHFIVPMHFAMPNLSDPLASAFLLPVDRYNANPLLTVQLGAQGEIDLAGSPALVQTTKLSLVVHRRIVNRLNWPVVDAEIGENVKSFSSTGDNQDYDIPITGYYTALLLRAFRTNKVKGDPSAATLLDGLAADANNPWRLELSGNTIRRFRLSDVEAENDRSEAHGSAQGDCLAGSYLLDFLTDRAGADSGDPNVALGSLLNANIPLNSGARLVLRHNIQVANTQMKYLSHRFYANLKDLKL